MSSTATVAASVFVNDGLKNTIAEALSVSFPIALPNNGKRETVSCASGFTPLTVPTGAKGALIRVEAAVVALTLKGITGDTGIPLTGSVAGGIPLLLPLGASPSLGILNGGATTTIEIIWF